MSERSVAEAWGDLDGLLIYADPSALEALPFQRYRVHHDNRLAAALMWWHKLDAWMIAMIGTRTYWLSAETRELYRGIWIKGEEHPRLERVTELLLMQEKLSEDEIAALFDSIYRQLWAKLHVQEM